MGLPEQPNLHRAHFYSRPGVVELWKPFAVEDVEESDEGEEGWLGEDARLYASAIAKQVRRWLDEAPILRDQAAVERGRRTGPGSKPKELASLIVARLFEEGVPLRGSTACTCRNRWQSRICFPRSRSLFSRWTISTSRTCWFHPCWAGARNCCWSWPLGAEELRCGRGWRAC